MTVSAKPVIGVISNHVVEDEGAYIVKARYVDAVARYADAVPLICPSVEDAGNAAAIIERLDAVLLTGATSNIEPGRYGAASGRAPFDPRRDAMSGALIAAAMAAGKPVFGICRGLQEINVALGGKLVDQRDGSNQHLAHHAPEGVNLDAMFAHSHAIEVVPGTPLAGIAGEKSFAVNSVHFQAIGTLGRGLVVNARAADGVVEALSSSGTGAPILAVQWHPEWRPEGRAHDLAFWRNMGEVARAYMGR
ncbi:Peptidase C26 [Devosia sp. LC5]|uniref:gamma-glutamyl-gamma-aminobutyrate hydrolase family protein n=1 Tax=Devosia sp. LC5 TaxID=1502724 RepID=UPI0004E381FC|nr:gamma-glutamyl-gamma-aminobutyrate hydrolase family protein [Devosia sp. LC5]KFC70575.1 Peptidase C26 [Devosia sp. LC5]